MKKSGENVVSAALGVVVDLVGTQNGLVAKLLGALLRIYNDSVLAYELLVLSVCFIDDALRFLLRFFNAFAVVCIGFLLFLCF